MRTAQHIGVRIREERKRLRLTQVELGRRSGITQAGISKIERGLVEDPRMIIAISRALDVSPAWLRTGEGPKAPPRWDAADLTEEQLQALLAAAVALRDGTIPVDDFWALLRIATRVK